MSPLRPGAVLVGLWLLSGTGAARAEPPPRVAGPAPAIAADKDGGARQAMTLHDEAWALYEQGHYHAAIDKLEAALRMDPNGKELVYNLALLNEKLANLKAAEGYYRRYLDMETDPRSRARIQGVLKRLEGAQRDSDAASTPSPAPPPSPSLAPAPPASRPVRPGVIGTGAAASVALLTGSIFGLAALSRNPGAHPTTGPGVTVDQLQTDAHAAHTYAIVADVSFVIAAAATATAVLLYFTTPRADQAARVAAGPGRLRVSF